MRIQPLEPLPVSDSIPPEAQALLRFGNAAEAFTFIDSGLKVFGREPLRLRWQAAFPAPAPDILWLWRSQKAAFGKARRDWSDWRSVLSAEARQSPQPSCATWHMP